MSPRCALQPFWFPNAKTSTFFTRLQALVLQALVPPPLEPAQAGVDPGALPPHTSATARVAARHAPCTAAEQLAERLTTGADLFRACAWRRSGWLANCSILCDAFVLRSGKVDLGRAYHRWPVHRGAQEAQEPGHVAAQDDEGRGHPVCGTSCEHSIIMTHVRCL